MENSTKSPPVRLVDLASELGIPVEDLKIDARDVFVDAVGFRVTTGFMASRVLEIHRAREAKTRARAEQNNAQVQAAHRRAQASIGKGVEKLSLNFATIDVSPIPAGAAMLAREPVPEYEGSTMTKRPSRLDWLTGKGEGGGTFGPTRSQVRRTAQEKKREKGGGK